MRRAVPLLLAALALSASAALANGPHVRLYFFTQPGLKSVPMDAYWEANFTGERGLEIVATVVRTFGTLDLLFMNQSQFEGYRRALSAGEEFDFEPATVKLNATRSDLNFRLPEGGTYYLVLDNTDLPPGGAVPEGSSAAAYVLFGSTSPPGVAPAQAPNPLLSVLVNALALSVVLGLASFAAVAFDRLRGSDVKRALLAGALAAPVFAAVHGGLTFVLLLPFEGPGGNLAAASGALGLVEGLYAIPAGLAFLGARRVFTGGPVKQGAILLSVAWGVFVFVPWLQSPAATSSLDRMLLVDELVSFLVLGAVIGWFWKRLESREGPTLKGREQQA